MALIGIDCRFASLPAGLGTYTRELVTHLVHSSTDDFVLFVRNTDEQWLESIPDHVAIITADFPHYSLREQIVFPRLMRQLHLDLFFCPHFNVPFFCPVPFVVTIHDLILHHYPNQTSALKQIAYRVLMRRAVSRAKCIISVSAYTTSELISVYGDLIARKIYQGTEGVNPLFAEASRIDVQTLYHLPEKYFLYVGNAKEHKNVQMLIDAHVALNDGSSLVLVTGGPEADRLRMPSNVIRLQGIPIEHLPSLYAHAVAFVTPSLYEGFCLPVLEASQAKCPVIAVNRCATPEVVGPNGVLVEPTVEALVDAMKNPPTESSPLDEKYNWESVAIDVSGILSSILHGQN